MEFHGDNDPLDVLSGLHVSLKLEIKKDIEVTGGLD